MQLAYSTPLVDLARKILQCFSAFLKMLDFDYIWIGQGTPLLPLLPGLLWYRVLVPVRVPTMALWKLFVFVGAYTKTPQETSTQKKCKYKCTINVIP